MTSSVVGSASKLRGSGSRGGNFEPAFAQQMVEPAFGDARGHDMMCAGVAGNAGTDPAECAPESRIAISVRTFDQPLAERHAPFHRNALQ